VAIKPIVHLESKDDEAPWPICQTSAATGMRDTEKGGVRNFRNFAYALERVTIPTHAVVPRKERGVLLLREDTRGSTLPPSESTAKSRIRAASGLMNSASGWRWGRSEGTASP
jgi:hypothetical protein